MSHIVNATAKDFSNVVLAAPEPVLVDFWAAWCGPCRAMEPALEELALEWKGKIKIVKVNVDSPENQELSGQYHILSIPNMQLFKNGEIVGEFIGLHEKEDLKKGVEDALARA